MVPGSSPIVAEFQAMLGELGGDRYDAEHVLAALIDLVEEDRRLRSRVLHRARDLLDEQSDATSLSDLLRP